MQGQQHDSPRLGEDPQPGHWSAGTGSFAGMAYIAHGLDCLAEQAGLADGLSLLLGECGITTGDVRTAEPWQVREWYRQCYDAHSGRPAAGAWDVVAFSSGIHGQDSGWCLPDPPLPPRRRPYRRKTGLRLRPGQAAGNHTDEYVRPAPARGCKVLR